MSDGVMVALVPPRDLSQRLLDISEGTEPLDEQHITMIYLGSVDDIDHDLLLKTVHEWSVFQRGLSGRVSGFGTFENPDENVLYASWYLPNGMTVRQSLVDALGEVGMQSASQHPGWTPHQTMSYGEQPFTDLPTLPDDLPVAFFSGVTVAYGGIWTNFSFLGQKA